VRSLPHQSQLGRVVPHEPLRRGRPGGDERPASRWLAFARAAQAAAHNPPTAGEFIWPTTRWQRRFVSVCRGAHQDHFPFFARIDGVGEAAVLVAADSGPRTAVIEPPAPVLVSLTIWPSAILTFHTFSGAPDDVVDVR
jgi:hypothetical protein